MTHQPGILEPAPPAARYLTFRLAGSDADPAPALERLGGRDLGGDVIGVGPAVVARLGRLVPGLRELPALTGPGVTVPSTPAALWCWLRGDDPGDLLHRGRSIAADLAGSFVLEEALGAFRHGSGRDLTGYEDGTENPTGEAAVDAAFVAGAGPGMDGSSFVAVQRWRHDFGRFETIAPPERDLVIGRRLDDNEEIDDAPPSAHVKRTAQESFTPEAFVLRRSMPWADAGAGGLVFVAFGRSLDAFEAQLRRMAGHEDGVPDALFRFTRPETGGAFWCPPRRGSGLDLSALGLSSDA